MTNADGGTLQQGLALATPCEDSMSMNHSNLLTASLKQSIIQLNLSFAADADQYTVVA